VKQDERRVTVLCGGGTRGTWSTRRCVCHVIRKCRPTPHTTLKIERKQSSKKMWKKRKEDEEWKGGTRQGEKKERGKMIKVTWLSPGGVAIVIRLLTTIDGLKLSW